ncbi:helix-turn-helix domain-containing protein [Flavobacterium laiguense]|nr:helix-turn-helix transcriptional regulator [Flavobacterium laiguense]
MSISLRIKELINKEKISQKELSVILKVDPSQISKILQGKLQPTLAQIMEISSIFKVSLDWLCFGTVIADGKKDEDLPNNQNYKELAEARLETIEGLKFKIATFEKDEKATMSEQEVKKLRTMIEDRESSVPRGAVEDPDRPRGSKLGEEIGK